MLSNNQAVDAAVVLLDAAIARIKDQHRTDTDEQVLQGAQNAFAHLNNSGEHITEDAVVALYSTFRS